MNDRRDFVREFFKRWPRFYYCAMVIFGPVLFVNLSPRGFLKKYYKEGKTLNIGSGPRLLAPDIINVDIAPYEHVAVVADAAKLPFADSSIGRIVYDTVLEHVERPEETLAEAARVVSPGGYVYISAPFMYPFHSSPSDYTRWSDEGMKGLLNRHHFRVVEEGVRGGPVSILVLWFAYFFASLLCLGSSRLYTIIANVVLVVLFPVKIIDLVAARLPFAERFASILYFVGKKN